MTELVLGVDTSTRVCVGVARDGEVVASITVGDSRSHVELLMPAVHVALEDAGIAMSELTAVAIGMGPGPFTGLRVGVAAAEMIAEARGIRSYHVCSLDILALSWAQTHPLRSFVACTDARRKELYWATYDQFGQRTDGPFVSDPSKVPDLPCVGPGTLVYPGAGAGMDSFLALKLGVRVDSFASHWPSLEEVSHIVGIDAGLLAACGAQLPDVGAEPLYLRHADASLPSSLKSVLGPGAGPTGDGR
jgi:tRNA threonylcarbamoyl adenosine modification protein YeaZ